ncbi:hypothetical protein MLD38_021555 [Melastoma candidum]|uniref:Uncharacterized protein n=1 Tax=Melastoma candidum TaxID=119954 RepID=A0ACB9QKC4_9MYRT|nr:hypothetical protein MLD38_021555 [Melastoma candidum]
MDVESSPTLLVPKPRRSCAPARCCSACVAVFCLIVIVLIIFGLTRYMAKNPTTTVDSITIHSIDFSLVTLKLNLTLGLILTIDNPNRVSFKYHNSTALLNFKGHLIGQVLIPTGYIGSHGTETLNLTLTVFADRLLTNNQAFRDVALGSLPLNTYTKISGKVRILQFIKLQVLSTSSCNFDVYVYNGTTGEEQCRYRTKL